MRENLRKARKEKNMTQQNVADYLEVTLQSYQKIEYGERIGRIEIWDKLEDLFNIHQRKLREISKNHLYKKDNLKKHQEY